MEQPVNQSEKSQGASRAMVVTYVFFLLAALWTGAYLWINKPASSLAPTGSESAVQMYTDTAKLYTLSYPAGWTLNYDPSEGAEGLARSDDWSQVSRGYTLTDPHAPKWSQAVSVHVDEGGMAANVVQGVIQGLDEFHTLQKLRINGHEVYYDKIDYVGPSAAEKYTDHYYHIVNGDEVITLTFREKYYHDYPYENWDNSSDLAAFRAVVYSVRFL